MSQGQGSVSYSNPSTGSGGGGSATARNGLSIDGVGAVVFGQDVGAAGDPALMISAREIPENGYPIIINQGVDGIQPMLTLRHQNETGTLLLFPTLDSGVNEGDYMLNILENYINPGGQRDAGLELGYNIGRIFPDDGQIRLAFESSYIPGGEPGEDQFEFHCPATVPRTGGGEIRHMSWLINKTTGFAECDMRGVTFNFFDALGTAQRVVFSTNTGGYAFSAPNGAQCDFSLNNEGGSRLEISVIDTDGIHYDSFGLAQFFDSTCRFSGAFGIPVFISDHNETSGDSCLFIDHQSVAAKFIMKSEGAIDGGATVQWMNTSTEDTADTILIMSSSGANTREKVEFQNVSTSNTAVIGSDAGGGFIFAGFVSSANVDYGVIDPTGRWGLQSITAPTAVLQLPGSTLGAAGTGPLKLTAGTLLTSPENGLFEYDGTNLYFTIGGTRKTVTLI